MKKWIVIGAILMCCLVYAIVKLSMSEDQNAYKQTEETQSVQQINADNTDQATPEEDPNSESPHPVVQVDVPAAQVEAVTKAFSDFQNAIKIEDYEQVWKLTSEAVKSELSFEEFIKGINVLANAIIHPESAIIIEGRVGLRVTVRHEEQEMDLYMFFIQEDGQWKASGVEPAQNVDTSKE